MQNTGNFLLRLLRRPLCPLYSLRSFSAISSRLPSTRLSNMLDPNSLMEDLQSELFNYTTGRFL